MKLRAIALTNIRRFAGKRARLSGIGDGITVLSEPNEFGKSTFFDALHALFFERHTSRNATIKALQPHAGGAPEVAVTIDLPEGRFDLTKRWLARPVAQVADGQGRLVAQADDAEAWIAQLLGGGLAGPSGLLWVRQGLLGLEADTPRDRERDLSARRDLLSSVAGEIDLMTGGRRMDAVLAQLGQALGALATEGGKPKAGGAWKRALDEAAALAAQEADLRPRALALSSDLARRSDVTRILARLTDPADMAARAATLAEARAAHDAALAHQAQVEQAATVLRAAKADAARTEQELSSATALAARLSGARAALAQAAAQAQTASTRATEQGARAQAAQAQADRLAGQTRDLRARLQAATRASAAGQARARAADLQRRLDRAAALQATRDQSRAQAAQIPVTIGHLKAIEAATSALDLARARAGAQAVTITARGVAMPASMNGAPLPDGPVPILTPSDLTLPGFGTLHVDPGPARAGESIAQAQDALTRALDAAQMASLTDAQAAWTRASALQAAAKEAATALAELAPDGLDALRADLAQAMALALHAPAQAEDPATLTQALDSLEGEAQTALVAAQTAQSLAAQAGEARAGAQAHHASAARHLDAILAEAGDPAALDPRIMALRGRLPALHAATATAEASLRALTASAPDLTTAQARLTRAQSALDQAQSAAQKAREDLASLNATITALAEEGIEERLSTLTDQRLEAEARAARYGAEARALARLRQALEDARAQARDAYFGPVLRELQPLLAILHPGAELGIDDASLLPATLTRNGQAEALDILSGGTREQVAILTRLAFARLFARAGRSVPVILDDALVHSDDDRIEAMFDALHRSARDQQILVLTCRQRAFAALGGHRAAVVVEQA